jgi:hypothetical protein
MAESPRAAEFSADIVTRDVAGLPVGTAARIYVANRKVRIETPEASGGFFLIDGKAGTALFVRSTQPVFMDAKQSTLLTQVFIPVASSNACPMWLAAAENAGVPTRGNWRCARIEVAGTGTAGTGITGVAKRHSIEYVVGAPEQNSSRRSIDPTLGFPVKLLAADGTTIALEHIRFEPQPLILFTIPPGYHQSQPQALLDRIKHSDVWAAPDAQ